MDKKQDLKRTRWLSLLTAVLMLGMIFSLAGEVNLVTARQLAAQPEAVPDSYVYHINVTLEIDAANGVLVNDTDLDGDPLTAHLVTDVTYGTLTLNLDGSFTYIPTTGSAVPDSFTYRAYDGSQYSNTVIVTLTPSVVGDNCIADECPGSLTCTANDVRITQVYVKNTIDYCTEIGDTGTYEFALEFLAGANRRYDPTVWIAIDGGDARTGQCYKEYLGPDLATAGLPEPPDDLFGPPWWDLDSDSCGDLKRGQYTYKEQVAMTIPCNQNLMENSLLSAVVAWDNQAKINCDAGGACPGTPAKCNAEDITVEIKPDPVDLSLTKTFSEIPYYTDPEGNYIKPGDIFKYTLTVNNIETDSARFSIGYLIYDDLPIWLQVVEPSTTYPFTIDPEPGLGAEITTFGFYEDDGISDDGLFGDDTAEWCADGVDDPVAGCEGYGDIVRINEQEDLPAGASRSYSFHVKFWDGYTEAHCTDYPEDPRCLPDPTTNPSTIDNEACVRGNDREPTEEDLAPNGTWANNCGIAAVPTDVELLYFTATGNKLSIELNWATGSETNNAGFNLYRSTSEDGTQIKLNQEIIPSQLPGGGSGAEYSYIDRMLGRNGVKPNTVYYYWLEDVPLDGDSGLSDPVYASLTLGSLFKGKK